MSSNSPRERRSKDCGLRCAIACPHHLSLAWESPVLRGTRLPLLTISRDTKQNCPRRLRLGLSDSARHGRIVSPACHPPSNTAAVPWTVQGTKRPRLDEPRKRVRAHDRCRCRRMPGRDRQWGRFFPGLPTEQQEEKWQVLRGIWRNWRTNANRGWVR